jgi:putative ABC transport system permease protein
MGFFRSQTPIAWKNLVADPRKFFWSLLGITFAVVLMFVQNGFRNSLFDSTVRVVRLLDADLLIVSSGRYNLATEIRFDRQILRRASMLNDVAWSSPLFIDRLASPIRVAGRPSRPIRVISLDPREHIFGDQSIQDSLQLLKRPGQVLLDQRSKKEYGFELDQPNSLNRRAIELANQRIEVAGLIPLGTDFVHDGNIIMSLYDIPDILPFRNGKSEPTEQVDIGLIRLQDRRNLELVKQKLRQLAPNQIDVYTPEELAQRDIRFWGRNTPIGIIFTIGTVMGLVVGTIICYQILFNDISDHLPEFATLKAMGYSNRYFIGLVLCQAMYLACIGFIPGLAITEGLFRLLTYSTGLIMELSVSRVLSVFGLTLVMCVFSGLLAVRRLWQADPASLF